MCVAFADAPLAAYLPYLSLLPCLRLPRIWKHFPDCLLVGTPKYPIVGPGLQFLNSRSLGGWGILGLSIFGIYSLQKIEGQKSNFEDGFKVSQGLIQARLFPGSASLLHRPYLRTWPVLGIWDEAPRVYPPSPGQGPRMMPFNSGVVVLWPFVLLGV